MDLCKKVQASAKDYWLEPIDLRPLKFEWLESHIMECDPCAVVLEDVAEELFKGSPAGGDIIDAMGKLD